MKKIIIIFLSLIMCGCSWFGLLAAGDYSDSGADERRVEERATEAKVLNNLYYGSSKERIISELGKPIKKVVDNFPFSSIKGSPELPCEWANEKAGNCETRTADEAWFYRFKKKNKDGWYGYSFNVYFIKDVVVAIR
ncbi:MAG: hypothetical protein PHI86_00535 [Candidatus Omnitrophica bacterium]|nr:hypothetical protein [Candidatus Omnitrophota bacterium]HOX54225.1 hypothetical protein [Candidatus Omnitrophota bacterium]